MNRTFTHRLTTALAGPALALGIFAGTMTLAAPAEAGTSGTSGVSCSTMAMPGTPANAGALNPLTRAAQVAAVNTVPPALSGSDMTCPTAH